MPIETPPQVPPVANDLPISGYRDQIIRMLGEHQVLVICGETGSGKSTQLPQFCLAAGLAEHGMIGHTQPRRLAARSIAARIAEEMQLSGSSRVAYKIRFGDQTSDQTQIKLMTDGILLAETQSDRLLKAYSTLIIDEAHERSLNIDFLLGYLRTLIDQRPELRVIITSATIDAERFAEHFASGGTPAPILNVEGRGYPVEIRYLPWEASNRTDARDRGAKSRDDDDEDDDYDLSRHVIEGLKALAADGEADTLVFLPTERDIREVSHRVAGHYKRMGRSAQIDLLPLYARLPQAEQQRIFHPTGNKRRIIFATNVAESSLTVPDIHFVIDSGTARISRYSPRSKVQRLPIEPISRASADQRAGRCGRVGPGICVRLFSREDYETREPFTTPEIRRTNLAAVILQCKSLQLGEVDQFPFIDPPRPEAIREGVRTLRELGAIDRHDQLTGIGRTLSRMPVDPRVARMILAGEEFGVLPEMLVVAAALEIQDPRERPPDKREAADEAHRPFQDPRSDFVSYLKLWKFYRELRDNVSRSKLDRACRSQFLSPQRMREWTDVYRQLKEMCDQSFRRSANKRTAKGEPSSNLTPAPESPASGELLSDDRYALLHQAILTGCLSGIAMAGEKNDYVGAGGLKLNLWPGSGVFEKKPKWIVAAELVETSKQYARTVAGIQPQWIEPLAKHLVKRHFSDPHWSEKSGAAFCYEQVSLFGLPIVSRRRVPLSPIDRETARELLIEQGLVAEPMPTQAKFIQFNRRLIEWLGQLAAKSRRRELIVDPYEVQKFYFARLPEHIVDRVTLERWDRELSVPNWTKQLRSEEDVAKWLASAPSAIEDISTPYLLPSDMVKQSMDGIHGDAFPNQLQLGATTLPLQYRFEPGGEHDGVSITVPQAALSQLTDERLGWLVPGLLQAKITGLIKALPKRIRRNLVPAADVARLVASELADQYGKTAFMPAVCAALSRRAEMPITENDFTDDKLDEHLEFLLRVVDDQGQTLAEGRDAKSLKLQFATHETPLDVPDQLAASGSGFDWAKSELKTFDLDELPAQIVSQRTGLQLAQFPALMDRGQHVDVVLVADAERAERETRRGLVRLFSLSEKKELRSQVRWLPDIGPAKIKLATLIPGARFEDALIELAARLAFVEHEPLTRTRVQFERLRGERASRIAIAAQELALWLRPLADAYQQARSAWEGLDGSKYGAVLSDIHRQLDWLRHDDFCLVTPWQWLKHYPRYFQGIAYRIDRLRSGGLDRDATNQRTLNPLWLRWTESLDPAARNPLAQATSEFRWTFEELRVSLHAQPLGTSIKTSVQRCEKLLG